MVFVVFWSWDLWHVFCSILGVRHLLLQSFTCICRILVRAPCILHTICSNWSVFSPKSLYLGQLPYRTTDSRGIPTWMLGLRKRVVPVIEEPEASEALPQAESWRQWVAWAVRSQGGRKSNVRFRVPNLGTFVSAHQTHSFSAGWLLVPHLFSIIDSSMSWGLLTLTLLLHTRGPGRTVGNGNALNHAQIQIMSYIERKN